MKNSVKPGFSSDFGDSLRDDILKFQLDNEVVATITIEKVGDEVILIAKSKVGKVLSRQSFNISTKGLSSVVLEHSNKRLRFNFEDAEPLYCNLKDLYDSIDLKQDQLTDIQLAAVNSGINSEKVVKLNGIEDGAEKNIIEGIKLNNVQLVPDINRNIDLGNLYTAAQGASLENRVTTAEGKIQNKADKSYVDIELSKKQDNIDSTNKLDADLIKDGTSNKVYTIAEKNKLEGISNNATNVEASSINGNIKIDGNETIVYTLPTDVVKDTNYKHITVTSSSVSDGDTTFNKYDDTVLKGRVTTAEEKIDALETTVGDSNSGLVKGLADEILRATTAESDLDTRLLAIESKGRYLSTWNAETGKPDTYPQHSQLVEGKYNYRAGDYYIVNKTIASGNLMPDGSYISKEGDVWTVPSKSFSGVLNLGDQFQFDGTSWTHIASATTVAFANIQGDAMENNNLASKLNAKVAVADYNTKIAELVAEDAKKVDKVVNKSLVEDSEIAKLTTVEENAEKNIIEGIKLNGNLVSPDVNRVVDLGNLYTLTQGTALEGRVNVAEGKITTLESEAHTHANKAELDLINSGDKAKWDDAYNKRHEHGNKDLLDIIVSDNLLTAPQIAEINKVANKADKSYVDDELAKKQNKNLTFKNQSITTWVADSTYSDYGYKGTLVLSGVTSAMIPNVYFSGNDALSGNYGIVESYDGGIYIYSKENSALTIPTIVVEEI